MRTRWGLLPFVLLALAGMVWLTRGQRARPATIRATGSKLFDEVLAKVKTSAVDAVDEQELYRRAAAGVIDELADPYAMLQLPGEQPAPPDDLPVAPGLYLDRRDGLVVIVATVPGSPADSAGVRPGDRLLAVDSIPADPSRLDRVVTLLEGSPGTSLILRLRRPGTRGQLSLSLLRGELPRPGAVESSLLGGGVARIRVARFPTGTADSVRSRVELLKSQGARSLVLDLRGTVGGELAQGVALADLFLDDGTLLVVSRARPASATASFIDHSASPFASMPLAVLIDAGTAGAAEVVAGALQDHDRAAVLGSNSFGRGVTRSAFELGQGVSLSLTTSLWFTPNGRQIQRPPRPAAGDTVARPKVKSDAGRVLLGGGGIVPDREVAESNHSDFALAEARRLLLRAGSPAEVLALVTKR
jgi:carboxyl-terminal processing protease